MGKTVLVLGIGWEQEPMIKKIHDLGWKVIGIHYNSSFNPIIPYDNVFQCDLWDINKVLKICDSIKFDAVISDQDDYGHFLQAFIAEKFNLPGPTINQAQLSLNKYLQREECNKNGIKTPEYKLVSSPQEGEEFAKENGFPIILKPVDNRGSIGVVKVNTKKELFSAFEIACINSHSHLVIAERFIKGFEVTVDGFCFPKPKSLAVAEKGKLDDERQVSVDIKYPAELDSDLYQKIMQNNEDVAEALGYNFGMLHGEYIITSENEIYLVELANRGGGCYTSSIVVPNVSGVPILDYYIDLCLGIEDEFLIKNVEKNETVLKFFNFQNGLIKNIIGINFLKQNSNVLNHHFYIKEGEKIENMTNDADRHGFVIVTSDKKVRDKTNRIIERIKIDYN